MMEASQPQGDDQGGQAQGHGQGHGLTVPAPHRDGPDEQQPPVRYVVLIDSVAAGMRVARLFLDSRVAVAELQAAAPEVLLMTDALAPSRTAGDPAWDGALAGHSAAERAAAEIYTLDV